MDETNRRIQKRGSGRRSWLRLVLSLCVCFAAAAVGAAFPVDAWYDNLNRPSWAPPNYVFGPVWTVLYFCMAVAAWLVWEQKGSQSVRWPLVVFALQLILNAGWSFLFFGLHRPDLALVEIVFLLGAIIVTTKLFFRHSTLAGWLLVPYGAWVAFATVLNFAYWRLNS